MTEIKILLKDDKFYLFGKFLDKKAHFLIFFSFQLALGCVHHHLIETRQRMKVGLIVETAEAREVHHICVLLG